MHIDHYSLKFLLDLRLSIIPQHKWASKLVGYDFTVEYRPRWLNTVVDALSRHDGEQVALPTSASLHALSGLTLNIFEVLHHRVAFDPAVVSLRYEIMSG